MVTKDQKIKQKNYTFSDDFENAIKAAVLSVTYLTPKPEPIHNEEQT